MKKQIIMALLVGFVMPALAQNKNQKVEDRIQLARAKYAEALENIAYQMDEDTPANYTTVVRKQNWAAVGERTDKMEFYFNEIEDEEDPYPVGYTLLMARRNYNVTVRNHLEEYLFDNEGKPLFYYTRFTEVIDNEKFPFTIYGNDNDGLPEFEVRHYYDENGKVIRSIYKTLDEKGKMKEFTEKSHPGLIEELIYSTDFGYVKKIFDAIY